MPARWARLLALAVCLPLPALAQVPSDLLGRWTSSPPACEDDAEKGIAVLGLTPSGIGWLDIDCDIHEARRTGEGAALGVECFKGGGSSGKGRIEVRRSGPERIGVHVQATAGSPGETFALQRCASEAAITDEVKSSRWSHNGSTVQLYAEGDRRAFYYDRPRPGMIEAGARRGRLLFKGEIVGERYVGVAYVFSRRCGPRSFPVDGPILDEHARVVLKGKAPRVDETCKVVGHADDELEFVLLGK
jgi:hypothetical protein